MTYTKSLPQIDNIFWLAKLARPFPTTAGKILRLAKEWHFSRSTIDFLSIFPPDQEFQNTDDFISRSEALELLIRDQRKMPVELLRSAEG
jgi:hypothetical protein